MTSQQFKQQYGLQSLETPASKLSKMSCMYQGCLTTLTFHDVYTSQAPPITAREARDPYPCPGPLYEYRR